MDVCCEWCVLSGRGLCDGLITRPEESYRLCCVVVCDLETSRMGAPYVYDISRLRVKGNHRRCYTVGWTSWQTQHFCLFICSKCDYDHSQCIAHGNILRIKVSHFQYPSSHCQIFHLLTWSVFAVSPQYTYSHIYVMFMQKLLIMTIYSHATQCAFGALQ